MSRPAGFCALFLLLAACGDDTPDPAAASLAEFHGALSTGRGLDGNGWTALVQRAAVDLWPGTGEGDVEAQSARKVHSDLAYIAGDVAQRRAARQTNDAMEDEIHDGLLAAAAKGPAAYRAWIAKEGTALRTRRSDSLFTPPPR